MNANSKGSKFAALLGVFIVGFIIWGFGARLGGWKMDWSSFGIFLLIFGLLTSGEILKLFAGSSDTPRASRIPSAEETEHQLQRYRERYQRRQLRHLYYEAGAQWPNRRADDKLWIGVIFEIPPLGLVVRVNVAPVVDNENIRPEQMLAYARNYFENQIGCRLISNSVSTFLDHPCVVSEAVDPGKGLKILRYGFTIQMSEYAIQFTASSDSHMEAARPLIDDFLRRCRLQILEFPGRTVLGERIKIGIPSDWSTIQDEDDLCIWENTSGTLHVILRWMPDLQAESMDKNIFTRVKGMTIPPGFKYRLFPMPENGATVARAYTTARGTQVTPAWALDIVRLPSGSVVALETDHQGQAMEDIDGFLLDPLRNVLIASIQDGGVEVI